ncbi:S1 family peptidase [Streptomyces sp. NBRC 110028]|uniref:S1 family peptidase n=1 Tax=Streptomyces sp. NBRC 110028 TaxID=1621260 RepID=UPI000A5272A9|nr:S1 family peptidase [Streptomyces sp. NBRC 110028]
MRRAGKRLAQLSTAALLIAAATSPASANDIPKPLTDSNQATTLAKKLGDDRTGGMYYQDGRIVVTVTDPAAAQTVRDAGGIPKLVTRSAAELAYIHDELDQLGGIPNTAWGVEARTNQVNVEIFDGVSAANQDRLETVAAAHPDAIRIDRLSGKLVPDVTDLRGGNGISSDGWQCSAGFNTKNSAGTIYTLTAGHCVPGTGNTWYISHNGTKIGTQTAYNFGYGTGGWCDSASRACDWASIKADGPDINPLGTVRYWGGTYKQIDRSRFAMENESLDRIGVNSQDTSGNVTKTSVTVTYNEGTQLYGMVESNLCGLGGDSGGAVLNGSTALGLHSGSSDGDTECTSSTPTFGKSYATPLQMLLNQRGLHVY